jgi:hypothetical protein
MGISERIWAAERPAGKDLSLARLGGRPERAALGLRSPQLVALAAQLLDRLTHGRAADQAHGPRRPRPGARTFPTFPTGRQGPQRRARSGDRPNTSPAPRSSTSAGPSSQGAMTTERLLPQGQNARIAASVKPSPAHRATSPESARATVPRRGENAIQRWLTSSCGTTRVIGVAADGGAEPALNRHEVRGTSRIEQRASFSRASAAARTLTVHPITRGRDAGGGQRDHGAARSGSGTHREKCLTPKESTTIRTSRHAAMRFGLGETCCKLGFREHDRAQSGCIAPRRSPTAGAPPRTSRRPPFKQPSQSYSGLALGNDAPLALPNHAGTGASDQLRGAVSLPPKRARAPGASRLSLLVPNQASAVTLARRSLFVEVRPCATSRSRLLLSAFGAGVTATSTETCPRHP